jgi:transposase InsO family protein
MKSWWSVHWTWLWFDAAPKQGSCITVIEAANTPAEPIDDELPQAQMVVSMARRGKCWENAAMESFFGSLKEECVGSTMYPSHEQAKLSLFEYLEVYYNRQRRHSALGYVSPLRYEQLPKQEAGRNA